MKNFSLFLLLCISICCRAQDTISVQNNLKSIYDAMAEMNFEKTKSFCTSDLTVIENGILWNLDSIAAAIDRKKAITDFKRTNTFTFLKTKIDGTTARAYYYLEASGVANGKDFHVKWIESALLEKEKSGWKLALLHSTKQ